MILGKMSAIALAIAYWGHNSYTAERSKSKWLLRSHSCGKQKNFKKNQNQGNLKKWLRKKLLKTLSKWWMNVCMVQKVRSLHPLGVGHPQFFIMPCEKWCKK